MEEKTRVNITFQGMEQNFLFLMEFNEFVDLFNNNISGCGYYTGETVDGRIVFINPTNCGTIEISKVK